MLAMASLIGYAVHVFTRQSLERANSIDGKVRVWGKFTRNLLEVFAAFKDDEDVLPITNLRLAFNQLHLYPSHSQVSEMVQCAVEYGSPCKPNHITFGEFCVLVAELQNLYLQMPSSPVPKSLVRLRDHSDSFNCSRWKHRVFLGGSCNPTSWRQDEVIPYFKKHGITFYNPQVQNWRPELLELEEQAKQTADVLFFVIDNVTRAIASMIETSFLIALDRKVVVVIKDYESEGLHVFGDKVSDNEMNDLLRGRQILTDLVERNSIPVFRSLDTALHSTKLILEKGLKVSELKQEDGVQPVVHGHLTVGETLLQMREAFNSMDNNHSGKLSKADVSLAYKSCVGDALDMEWLDRMSKNQDNGFCFEEFCCIMTEYQHKSKTVSEKLLDSIRYFFHKFVPRPLPMNCNEIMDQRDIYLGGSCGDSNWRENIAIPLLRKYGLSFVNPFIQNWNALHPDKSKEQRLIPLQVSLRDTCRLLLYVITDRTRSIASMIEAGYYIGKGCKIVLCVQELMDNAVVDGEKLTSSALNDYQRGRAYLMDLANRQGIQLFDDITEAVMCAVSYLCDSATFPTPNSSPYGK